MRTNHHMHTNMVVSPQCTSPTGWDVWNAALPYVGVPWKHQGRRRDGVDCLGLLILVAIDLGLGGAVKFLDHQSRAYGRLPPNRLAQELTGAGCIRISSPVIGSIGLFSQPGAYPSHVGIFGDGEMIHGFAPKGQVVRHGFVSPWPEQVRGVFAYPGISYEE
jgi:hypothetical protein